MILWRINGMPTVGRMLMLLLNWRTCIYINRSMDRTMSQWVMLLVSRFKTQVLLTGSHFFVKDNLIGNTILEGPSVDGLCPINLQCCSINKPRSYVAFLGVSTSFDTWHARLGHASSPIVSRVLSSNNLPMTSSANKSALCEFCQYRKSKQLLFA